MAGEKYEEIAEVMKIRESMVPCLTTYILPRNTLKNKFIPGKFLVIPYKVLSNDFHPEFIPFFGSQSVELLGTNK
ncbi:hypothetical protein AKJ57_02960 [candidate division MSBL1 archaeon SCGC-AAA259A05]|nr:hypothetical protein AKJ57_02960 [candidate division MSBL1 archaeon SCGC-AAA259A05]